MMNQEPDFGSLMPDTFVDLGNTSYGAAIDDYQAQMDDFDLKGPNAQFISSNANYDEESTSGGGGGGGGAEADPIFDVCPGIIDGANYYKVYNLTLYRSTQPFAPWCKNDVTILLARFGSSVKWASIVEWTGDAESTFGTDTPLIAQRNPGADSDFDSKIRIYAQSESGSESKCGETNMSGYNLFSFTNGVEMGMFDGPFGPNTPLA